MTGFAYTNGVLSGTTALEQSIEILPKCCRRSLGANNYPLFGSDLRTCDAPLGFVFNVAATGGVDFEVTGSKSEIESDEGDPVEPLVCIGAAASPCPINEQVGNKQDTRSVLQIENNLAKIADLLTDLPAAQGSLEGCGDPQKKGKGGKADLCTDSDLFRYQSKEVPLVMDVVAADLEQLPAFCKSVASSYPVNGSLIVCNVSRLVITNGQKIRIITSDARRVRLYFPADDQEVITLRSGSVLEHDHQGDNPLLGLQLLGCEPGFTPGGCTDQGISVDSNSILGDLNPLFLYFPRGAISAGGGGGAGSQFNGVFWFDALDANGNVEFTISSDLSGLLLDLGMAEDGFDPPPASGPIRSQAELSA